MSLGLTRVPSSHGTKSAAVLTGGCRIAMDTPGLLGFMRVTVALFH